MIGKIRRGCYSLARLLGDVQAVRRGPKAVIKRVVNKFIGRRIGSRIYWR